MTDDSVTQIRVLDIDRYMIYLFCNTIIEKIDEIGDNIGEISDMSGVLRLLSDISGHMMDII